MHKTVYISGVTGFVGSHLKASLEEEYATIGLSRTATETLVNYEYLHKNKLLAGTKAFIHLAGMAENSYKNSNEKAYHDANVTLTKQVFAKFLESDCEVFIFMSSIKVMGEDAEGIIDENTPPKPVTPYGSSKLAAEKYLLKQQLPASKRVYIIRPSMIHGANNSGNIALLYALVSKGIPYPLGAFENKKSYTSITNIVFIIKKLLENSDIPSGIYCISDNQPISTKDIVSIIGASIPKKVRIVQVPRWIIKVIASLGNYFPIVINKEKLKKLTASFIVSNKKIKTALKEELPLSTNEGFMQTFRHLNTKNDDKNF